jgi:hypothetical protein
MHTVWNGKVGVAGIICCYVILMKNVIRSQETTSLRELVIAWRGQRWWLDFLCDVALFQLYTFCCLMLVTALFVGEVGWYMLCVASRGLVWGVNVGTWWPTPTRKVVQKFLSNAVDGCLFDGIGWVLTIPSTIHLASRAEPRWQQVQLPFYGTIYAVLYGHDVQEVFTLPHVFLSESDRNIHQPNWHEMAGLVLVQSDVIW